ncbi:MAG: substrate-binding domain-containing protein [Candidatus Promineifilaceae bacterium]|nr:substrate-binding domain-containing protein [Candidatus Promineifilaceae bacterium]
MLVPRVLTALLLVTLLLAPAGLTACAHRAPPRTTLRLATTTSTYDSGLLDAILPDFEEQHNARVDVIAVGTGQALALGEAGDADVLLVHAPAREEAFVEAGHGTARIPVMINDFVIVGPPADPAAIAGMPLASDALAAIAAVQAPFASRGDESGTHTKELALWEMAGFTPDPDAGWYRSLGQGMGETLTYANEVGAYTLADRGTFLAQQRNLPDLSVLGGGDTFLQNTDPALHNPYAVIPVSPDNGNVEHGLAQAFAAWITSSEAQAAIEAYGEERFGQPLFYAAAP